ncbi:hypothetical protein FH972_026560 [Carpinus fangiana]|uniref:Major facilitator superfamily (MFS) profile domain-containing protein n=1 Tax=Carpinus fangiana TaxID=176857 RepID=A0A5N6L4T4_9ROSI|nr:hypothetical protein FH972_026560 [Carpinus fangiana]
MAGSSLLPVADYGTTPRQSTSEGRPFQRFSLDRQESSTRLLSAEPPIDHPPQQSSDLYHRNSFSSTHSTSPLEGQHHFQMGGQEETGLEFEESLEGYTLYEKKCIIINREVDAIGMGKYQWYIWTLCGFGYLLDLMWAQAFGLVLQPLRQELGFGNDQSGNISASFNAGLTAGAAVWGILVDIVGRRWAFNLTVLFSTVFGLALGGANSYNSFLVLTAFVGFGVGGNIPIDTTITLECIPQPNFLADEPLPSCHNTAPGIPCCGKSQNMGWRYLLFTVGAITATVFLVRFALFSFQESPQFLISRGKDEKAAEVLQYIARFNGKSSRISLGTFEALEREHDSVSSRAGMLGSTKKLKSTFTEKVKLEGVRYGMLFNTWAMARLTTLSMFNSVLYGWTPEAFAAPIRGTACGVASFWGRLFGILGPLVAQTLLSTPPTVDEYNRILYMAGGVTLGCVLFTALLPGKAAGGVSM